MIFFHTSIAQQFPLLHQRHCGFLLHRLLFYNGISLSLQLQLRICFFVSSSLSSEFPSSIIVQQFHIDFILPLLNILFSPSLFCFCFV
ncbi:hypothetical protein RchiOBHm_Chr2g0154701 [Rosa chinensis]|uniref:Uncharacterized protein n=1 Tax=Rosa chinensis TaxID=74649 RepID=A0A2P6S112_ROSCH|nr:hypothetical protein RchiOBHm_Chr2g0154701 [Rosa chinensis]